VLPRTIVIARHRVRQDDAKETISMMTLSHKQGLRLALLTVLASLMLTALVPPTVANAATPDSEEAALCRTVNDYRAQNGLRPLLLSSALTNAAKWQSGDMAQKNYFSHTDSLGRDPFQRMAAFGYSYPTSEAENIAAGSSTATATFTQWKNSPGHNANMLSPNYTVMGIGRAYGASSTYGWYWTNTFGGFNDSGVPCPSSSPSPALTVNDVSVTEGNSGTKAATFTVTRSGDTSGASSVRYYTTNGTAVAGSDYVALPLAAMNFAAGETTKSVAVAVNGDTVVEPSETFYLNLSSPTGATISDASGTGTIQNDDTNIRVNDMWVGEGNYSNVTASFNVTRTGDTSGTSTVRYATADGTAIAGTDYVALPLTTLTFGPGETTKPVAVTNIGDTTPEPDETFFLKLSSPTGATLFDDSGTVTILNADDRLARVAVNDVSVAEGNSGTKTATFTITRSVDTSAAASVNVVTANGTAIAGSDYVALPLTTVNFAPGETTKPVTVTILGDTLVEPTETFYVRLSSPKGVVLEDASGTGTLNNDDSPTP